jgi:hypothetical protein
MTAGVAAEDECDEADEGETSAQVTGQHGEASGLDADSDVIQHWEIDPRVFGFHVRRARRLQHNKLFATLRPSEMTLIPDPEPIYQGFH